MTNRRAVLLTLMVVAAGITLYAVVSNWTSGGDRAVRKPQPKPSIAALRADLEAYLAGDSVYANWRFDETEQHLYILAGDAWYSLPKYRKKDSVGFPYLKLVELWKRHGFPSEPAEEALSVSIVDRWGDKLAWCLAPDMVFIYDD